MADDLRDEQFMHDGRIDIPAAEAVVTGNRKRGHHDLAVGGDGHLEDRHVARAAAEVEGMRNEAGTVTMVRETGISLSCWAACRRNFRTWAPISLADRKPSGAWW